MKRYLGILVFVSFSLLLCAHTITDVRTAQNIRYRGNVVKSSANSSWVFWEESAGSDYQLRGQKYDGLGNAGFDSPITIPTGRGSVSLVEALASSDDGIVLLFLQEPEADRVSLKVQKLNSAGQAQWTENGIYVGDTQNYKFPTIKICANNLGGAFLVNQGEYTSNGFILSGLNFDANGNNIWTAELTIPTFNWYYPDQLLLTDAGELIINLKTPYGNKFRKVNNNGTIVGSNPMFASTAIIPEYAKMQKGHNGNILIYSTDTHLGNPLLMQMMDMDGNLVHNSLKQLPLGFASDEQKEIKIATSSDGGFILSYLTGFAQWTGTRELRVQRLNAELEPIWGNENPLILPDTNFLSDLDMAVDASDHTWLTVVRASPNYYDKQVEVLRLDANGNPGWDTEVVSISGQDKFHPRFALLAGKAMLCWGDYNDDQVSLLRQICTATGDQLLQINGAQISSLLSGIPEVYGVYSLGDRTICLMEDDRGRQKQIYYQILDSSLNRYMPENGQALDPDEGRQLSIAGAKVSPQNTLCVVYYKVNGNASKELYLQEIDAAGNRLYPASGILLGTTEYIYANTAIGFEDEATYVYWTYFLLYDGNYLASIQAQKIIAGAIQWDAGGLSIYDYARVDLSPLDAHGRYLLFTSRGASQSLTDIRALYITPSGSVAANWPPQGMPVIEAGPGYNMYLFAQSGVIEDDLYCFVSGIEGGEMVLKAQKLNTSGERLWGDAGLQICVSDTDMPQIDSLIFGDEISILYNRDNLNYLQRLDAQGNIFFAGDGLRMPGDSCYRAQRLTQYANGVYSYFRVDYPEYYRPYLYLRHVYVSPSGSLQETQPIPEAGFDGLHTAMSDNKVVLYWTRINRDIFSWEDKLLFSVSATTFSEPIANQDSIQEPMPMISLSQNSPNPFTGSTRISYKLREASPVKLQIFNIKGQFVQELQAMPKAAGEYSWDWDGTDAHGQKCAGGIYLYKVQAGRYSSSKKMVLLK